MVYLNRSGMESARTASVLNVIAGIWMIISPFILVFTNLQTALWNNIIVGVVVLVLAWIRAANPDRLIGLSWLNLVLGLWLIVSPFVLVYGVFPPALVWNN